MKRFSRTLAIKTALMLFRLRCTGLLVSPILRLVLLRTACRSYFMPRSIYSLYGPNSAIVLQDHHIFRHFQVPNAFNTTRLSSGTSLKGPPTYRLGRLQLHHHTPTTDHRIFRPSATFPAFALIHSVFRHRLRPTNCSTPISSPYCPITCIPTLRLVSLTLFPGAGGAGTLMAGSPARLAGTVKTSFM